MSERRMFAKSIIDSDAFLDMPLSAQALYFHLSMRADDEGFINNPKKIQRVIGASDDDRKLLLAKNFIIAFESGVIVIKHWKIHNYIRADRLVATNYADEKSLLKVKENGAYTLAGELKELDGSQLSDICQTGGCHPAGRCRHSIGEDSIGEDSIGEYIGGSDEPLPAPEAVKHKRGKYKIVSLTDEEYNRLIKDFGESITEKAIEAVDSYCRETGKRYKDYNLTIRRWGIDAAGKQDQKPQADENYAKLLDKLEREGVV